jgi:PPOX class probable F420-dependent enzyme
MLNDEIKALAKAKNVAVLTTLMPDGQPQSQVMWVDADDDHILINTEIHRQKFKNIERDARATVTIIAADNPYRYAEVRGTVVEIVRGDPARAHIDELSMKYTGKPYGAEVQSERVVLKIAPTRQLARL